MTMIVINLIVLYHADLINFADHDIAESVDLSITFKARERYIKRAKAKFTFTLDMSVLLAQSLALNSTNSAALKQIEAMYCSLLTKSGDEQKGLDQRLLSAFKQLQLVEKWSLYDKQGIVVLYVQ